MDIYSKYGAVIPDVAEKLYDLEREAYQLFLNKFPDVSLTELRILFHEFKFGLECRLSEDILGKALKQKRLDMKEE